MGVRILEIEYKNETISLNLFDEGSGDAILLLHGWGTEMNVYKRLLSFLKKSHKVISYDIPGFGQSSTPSFPYSVDDYATLAFKVLEELKIDKVTLIGHSHGGRTILNMASRESIPVEIEKIILIDSAGIVPRKSFIHKMKVKKYKLSKKILSLSPIKKMFPDALEKFKSRSGSADYRAINGVLRDSMVKVVNDDYKDRMKNISSPTLLIWGTNDDATPISDAEFMEKTIPDCGLVKVEGGTHFCFLENPVLCERVIAAFLGISL